MSSDNCDKELIPDVTIETDNEEIKYSFLQIIDQSNYEAARTKAAASGDIELGGLFKIGDAAASYEQFSENRRELFEKKRITFNRTRASSVIRQIVTDEARRLFVECKRIQSGINLWFEREGQADDVNARTTCTLTVRYASAPGSRAEVKIQLTGGTFADSQRHSITVMLAHTAEQSFNIKRDSTTSYIKATANGGGLADTTESVPAVLAPPRPKGPEEASFCVNAQAFHGLEVRPSKLSISAFIDPECNDRGWAVNTNAGDYFGPDGYTSHPLIDPRFFHPTAPAGCLVAGFSTAKLSSREEVFDRGRASPIKVGGHLEYEPPGNGYLYFLCNDFREASDNAGSIKVIVEIRPK